jgi:cyclase
MLRLLLKNINLLFIAALFLPYGVKAQQFDTVQIRSVKLSGSIYLLQGGGGGNIGVCTGKDGTFIVDDQYAPLSAKVKAAIARLTDKPVQFIVNTHWHGDHSGGNETFGAGGAIIVSQENSRKRMTADQLFGLPAHEQKAYSSSGLPKITFTSSMQFHYNDELIRILHIGNAHTDGDAVIYFTDANVIHMGDVFVRYGFPFIDESNGGNINGMIETIDTVISIINTNTIIIPGHGQPAAREDLVSYNTMLKTVRDRIRRLMDEGRTMEEILKADPLKGYPQRGVTEKDFVTTVYKSILKSKKTG